MMTDVSNLMVFSQLLNITVVSANMSSVEKNVIIQIENSSSNRLFTIFESSAINFKEEHNNEEYYKFGVVVRKEKEFTLITIPLNTFPSVINNLIGYYKKAIINNCNEDLMPDLHRQ